MNHGGSVSELLALVEPFYPQGRQRPPAGGTCIMLRTYFLQQWFSHLTRGWRKPSMSRLCCGALPESIWAGPPAGRDHDPSFPPSAENTIWRRDAGHGEPLRGKQRHPHHPGTIVDATIIHAPSSTKNASGERDPEMHQTKKGNQWYFGAGAHPAWIARRRLCFCDNFSGQRGRQTYAARLIARRGAQGMGRWRHIRARAKRSALSHRKRRIVTCRRTKYKNYVDEEAKRKNTPRPELDQSGTSVSHPQRVFDLPRCAIEAYGKTPVAVRGFALVNLSNTANRLAPQRA